MLATWVGAFASGGQGIVLTFPIISPSWGEAMQFHAWLALAVAVPLGGWALVATASDGEYARIGALVLSLAGGITTVFLVLSGTMYVAYAGDFALPLVLWVSQLLPTA